MRGALLLTIFFVSSQAFPPVAARIQPEFVCWESDMEFPVACDDE